MIRRNILSDISLSLLLLTQLTLASCYQKELCYTHPHTKLTDVVFDWRNAPTAHPATMSLHTFAKDDGESMRYEFTNYQGGKADMALGAYDALCINSDGRRNYFRNMEKRETFEVYTKEVTVMNEISEMVVSLPRARGAEKERMAFQPDSVWCDATLSPFILKDGKDTQDSARTLTLYPRPIFCTYTVEIRNAKNLGYVKDMSATLSGLSGGMMAASGIPTEELVTIPFDVHKQKDNTSIKGRLRTFGYGSKQAKPEHKVVIYVVLGDGSRQLYTYDVTAQVRKAPDPRHVHIILDGLPLPKPAPKDAGFSFKPTVKEWQRVEIPIEA